jgi:hypothetical protein
MILWRNEMRRKRNELREEFYFLAEIASQQDLKNIYN